jgi:MFS family permease
LVHFAAFVFWEARIAKSPILPFDIWTSKSFGLLLLLASCSFMSIGIFIWYFTLFGLNIRHYSLIEVGLNWLPLAILGTAANFLSAWLIPRVQAQYMLGIGNLALVTCNTLLATARPTLTYWAMMFPAAALAALTVDFIFAASQIIASGQVDKRHQGVAGSLIGTLLTYGLSTGLGFAGTIQVYTANDGKDILHSYRNAVYLAIGFAGLGFVGSILFLRVPKTTKEGWDEDPDVTSPEVTREEEKEKEEA